MNRVHTMGTRESVFRILMADDSPDDTRLFERLINAQSRPCLLKCAKDGAEALDLLRSDFSAEIPLPGLILMDLNMPRVNGLEALRAIKSDRDLCVIPVIILSSCSFPAEVRTAYETGANCFVQKPTEIEGWERLVRTIQAFWMDLAVPTSRIYAPGASSGNKGTSLASAIPEARSQAISMESGTSGVALASNLFCDEHRGPLDNFAATVKELLELHEQQFQAIVQGDPDCQRFDLLIHMANEKKQLAKYAYVLHVESHGCLNFDAANNS